MKDCLINHNLFSIIANLTSKLTINTLKSEINNVSDLVGKKVGTIGGSTSEPWCEERGINIVKYKNIKECVRDLQNNKLDAIIYDVPILKYIMANEQTDDLMLAGAV
jgi:polar amino acid transport system substrate-binding protein